MDAAWRQTQPSSANVDPLNAAWNQAQAPRMAMPPPQQAAMEGAWKQAAPAPQAPMDAAWQQAAPAPQAPMDQAWN